MRSLLGSMASTARRCPCLITCSPNTSMDVDLPAPGHQSDAYAPRLTCIRQAFLYNFLRHCLMAVGNAFHKRNGLSEDAHVAFHDSVHIVGRRELAATERAEFEIRFTVGCDITPPLTCRPLY